MCNITCHGYIATNFLTIGLLWILCITYEHYTGYLAPRSTKLTTPLSFTKLQAVTILPERGIILTSVLF